RGNPDHSSAPPSPGPASLGPCLMGGAFAGSAFGVLAGDYVFGDCTSSVVYHVTPNAARDGLAGPPATAATRAGTAADVVSGPDGAIYYVADSAGQVRRLATVPNAATSSTTTTLASAPSTTSSPSATLPPGATTTTLPCTTAQCTLGAALASAACVEQP